jgi:hypothetical protein
MSNVCKDRAFRVSTGSQRLPQLSISQVSTLTASFEDDVGAFGTNYPDSPRDVCIREGFSQRTVAA